MRKSTFAFAKWARKRSTLFNHFTHLFVEEEASFLAYVVYCASQSDGGGGHAVGRTLQSICVSYLRQCP